jgi:hypothetical protein
VIPQIVIARKLRSASGFVEYAILRKRKKLRFWLKMEHYGFFDGF